MTGKQDRADDPDLRNLQHEYGLVRRRPTIDREQSMSPPATE